MVKLSSIGHSIDRYLLKTRVYLDWMMALDFASHLRMVQQGLGQAGDPHLSLKGSYRPKENQLQFRRDVLTHPANLAAHFSTPCPIVIEKLCTPRQTAGRFDGDGAFKHSNSSISFSVVSEERLNLALQLAKRDVKRKHVRGKPEVRPNVQSHEDSPQLKTDLTAKHRSRTKTNVHKQSKDPVNASKPELTRSGARIYVYTQERSGMRLATSDSPPTHDPGPGNRSSPRTVADPCEREVKRLQKELRTYMQKIDELARKEHAGEILDPIEEERGRIRQQERAARSARMLYVLQQQVKEIQEELDHLSPQKIKHTKKSRTMSRLAAVHRGAVRALQLFVTQLSERGELQIPNTYKDLGHLIRQLSLCTAKVETGSDPAASTMILSILQQAEDLDHLLERKIYSHRRRPSPNAASNRSPSAGKRSSCEAPVGSPNRDRKGPPPVLKQLETCQETLDVKKRLLVENSAETLTTATQTEPAKVEDPPTPERRDALKSAVKALIQAGRLKGIPKSVAGQHKRKGVLLPFRPQGFRQPRKMDPSQPAHFQKKTVAFSLKENQPPIKEKKTPWMPPNPTSPPATPKRVNLIREKKKHNISPTRELEYDDLPQNIVPGKTASISKEAVRLAWLDAETARRTEELDSLYRQEISHMRSLRDEILQASRFPNQDRPLDYIQRPQTFNQENLPGRETDESDEWIREQNSVSFLHHSDLEVMIQRMEEIEKSQEIVRQRCNKIVYADPEFWAQEEKDRVNEGRQQIPRPPHPIRITKPRDQREPVVDILLEEPFEGDSLQITRKELVRSPPRPLPQKQTGRSKGLVPLSVSTQMLQSIKNYTESFDRRLQLTSHEVVNNFNPWHISESLAEELFEEAVEEVAAELQDVCESYSEAVFTSEFLEPAD
uniref:KIAA0753 n=1 Tax=Leptobrachium leishanense TaxID=445787 RepID=A0A8C5LS70_9ANUR